MDQEKMASLAREVARDADDYKKLMRIRETLDSIPSLKTERAIRDHDVRIQAKVLLANLDTGTLETAIERTIKLMWPEIMARLEKDMHDEIAHIEERWKEFA